MTMDSWRDWFPLSAVTSKNSNALGLLRAGFVPFGTSIHETSTPASVV